MSMTESSAYSLERSRKIHTTILNHLSDIGQASVAKQISLSEGEVSKLKNTHLEHLSSLLSACGLKVVPESYRCTNPKNVQAMVTLYDAAMSKIPNTLELLWGDE